MVELQKKKTYCKNNNNKTVGTVTKVAGLEAIYSNHQSNDMMSASCSIFYTVCEFMGNWQL